MDSDDNKAEVCEHIWATTVCDGTTHFDRCVVCRERYESRCTCNDVDDDE